MVALRAGRREGPAELGVVLVRERDELALPALCEPVVVEPPEEPVEHRHAGEQNQSEPAHALRIGRIRGGLYEPVGGRPFAEAAGAGALSAFSLSLKLVATPSKAGPRRVASSASKIPCTRK